MSEQALPRIYLSPPHLGEKEALYLTETLAGNWIAPVGENLNLFEKQLKEYVGVGYAVALNTGTAALHLALKLAGVTAGDWVIAPTFTFVATVNPILYEKAIPIWVESEAQTWNISPIFLEEALSYCQKQGKMPKAIVLAQIYGNMAQMNQLKEIATYYQIPIIEDAAEALGSSYEGKKAGAWGDIAVVSFNGNKMITTSAGGMLLTNQAQWAEKALHWANQAKEPLPYYEHKEIGYNYRMSNVLAAIGRAQMEVLEERVQKRREIFRYYQTSLPNWQWVEEEKEGFYNRWLSCICLPKDIESKNLIIKLMNDFEKANIEVRRLWKPMHQQPIFRDKYLYFGDKFSEHLFERGLCLPSGTAMQLTDLERVMNILKKI